MQNRNCSIIEVSPAWLQPYERRGGQRNGAPREIQNLGTDDDRCIRQTITLGLPVDSPSKREDSFGSSSEASP